MKNKPIENYYVISHNSLGLTNVIKSNVYNLKKLILLKSNSCKLSDIMLNRIFAYLEAKNHNLEIIHNSLNNNRIDGLIDLTENIGFISEELYTNDINVNYTFDLNTIVDSPIFNCKENIKNHKEIIALNYSNVYKYMEKAKKIHDEWEEIYIRSMNFDKANKVTEDISNKILQNYKFDKVAIVRERFFGAITPNGADNYVEEIIDNINYRYFIKGRPGTGKSSMMKKIASSATDRGIDVDLYYCASDPNSLDMLVFKELDTCIFDSTSPHEFFPYRPNDFIVDMYTQLLPPYFDLDNEAKLTEIKSRYSVSVQQSIAELKEIEKVIDRFESKIYNSIKFDKLEKMYNDIFSLVKA